MLGLRKMTWALIAWTLLMGWWLVASVNGASTVCNGQTVYSAACKQGADIGTGIGVTFIFFLWVLGFIVLALIWFMSRPRRRLCPHCGSEVKAGLTVCQSCGYNFAAPAQP